LNTKTAIIGLAVGILIGILVGALAQYYATYYMPSKSKISYAVTFTLMGVEWTNGTTADWGTMDPGGIYAGELNVTNTSSDIAFNVTILIQNCNCTWFTFTYASNGTIVLPATQLIDDIVLEVDAAANPVSPDDVYTWDMWIVLAEVP